MLNVFEAFAGVGTQRMALERLGIDHKVVGIAEIDKFAIASYKAIHGETKNYGDISKVDVQDLVDFDLFTYSFPCQDISMAGKQAGFDKDSGTRSSLLWECERIIKAKRPKYLLMENVKALTFKNNIDGYNRWLDLLKELGYTNYSKVLNAKHYGIPQNRERVFCVSILDDEDKDFTFPEPVELTTRLKDVLEESVDKKYYLSEKRVKKLTRISNKYKKENSTDIIQTHKYALSKRENPSRFRVFNPKGISPTITTSQGGGIHPHVGAIRDRKNNDGVYEQQLEINPSGDSNTITTVQKDNVLVGEFRYDKGLRVLKDGSCPTLRASNTEKMVIKNGTKKGYLEAEYGDGIDLINPTCNNRRGRVQKESAQTLTCNNDRGVVTEDLSIRKLTPLECWRLMGIDDKDFYKAKKVNSDTQLYKQAGNAIVVDVLVAIFDSLFN